MPKFYLGCQRKDGDRGESGDHQVHQRPRDGNANVAPGIRSLRTGFFHQRHAADRQQQDRPHHQPIAARHQRVTQFMRHHAAKDDQHEYQPASRSTGTQCRRLREPHKRQQKQKRQMDTDIDAKQSPCRK